MQPTVKDLVLPMLTLSTSTGESLKKTVGLVLVYYSGNKFAAVGKCSVYLFNTPNMTSREKPIGCTLKQDLALGRTERDLVLCSSRLSQSACQGYELKTDSAVTAV